MLDVGALLRLRILMRLVIDVLLEAKLLLHYLTDASVRLVLLAVACPQRHFVTLIAHVDYSAADQVRELLREMIILSITLFNCRYGNTHLELLAYHRHD